MNNEVRKKYIEGNTTMELAQVLGNDLFETYLICEIDKVDGELDNPNNDVETYNCLQTRKRTLQNIREAYYDLKK